MKKFLLNFFLKISSKFFPASIPINIFSRKKKLAPKRYGAQTLRRPNVTAPKRYVVQTLRRPIGGAQMSFRPNGSAQMAALKRQRPNNTYHPLGVGGCCLFVVLVIVFMLFALEKNLAYMCLINRFIVAVCWCFCQQQQTATTSGNIKASNYDVNFWNFTFINQGQDCSPR